MKKDDSEELNTLINVGSEVYMQAKTSDKKYIFINIGLGFHAQFTLDEAQVFIEKKLRKLEAWGSTLLVFMCREVVLKKASVNKVQENYYSVS